MINPLLAPPRVALQCVYGRAASGLLFVGGIAQAATTSASIALSLGGTLLGGFGASPLPGDLVLGIVACTGTSDRALALTGNGNGSAYAEVAQLYSNDSEDTNLAVFAKIQGSTPDTTLTGSPFPTSGQYGSLVGAVVLRGQHATWSDASATTVSAANQNTGRCNPPAITPESAGAWAITFAAAAMLGAGNSNLPTISGWTSLLRAIAQGTVDACKLVVAAAPWTSGALDPPVWTDSDGDATNNSYAAITVAVRPA